MYCRSYPLLYQAYKTILTLYVAQVGCERTFSKLRYVQNSLRNQLSEDRLDSLLLMCVERDVLLRISNHTVIDKPAKMNAIMRRLALCIVFDNVCLLILIFFFEMG